MARPIPEGISGMQHTPAQVLVQSKQWLLFRATKWPAQHNK